ncbi:hypothetical protein ACFWU5_16630 [Nocardia sp. NPDC058640]|uniref:hypothetical protein n=1 Tax=Nocardia sp. NPDC058640 TaxID=3346571 RepID=UPI003659D912
MDDDPISADEATIMAAVIDMIEPDTAFTAEQLHRQLVAEMSEPPGLHDVRSALEILRMPHVEFRPGESSVAVLGRMRTMLDRARNPPPTDLDRYLGNLPY